MFDTAMTRAVPVQEERMVRANGVDLRMQAFGDPSDPALLLIMGATASMRRWPQEFCIGLAEAGRFVIRYDNRDTGRSTTFPVGSAASGAGKDSGALSAPPQQAIELFAFLAGVDWTDEAQAIEAWVREDAVLLGPGDTPEPDLDRANVIIVVREARNILSHRKNHPVVVATSYWRDRLKDIRTPTLVMHGSHDYCLPLDHAKAMAHEIPGAKLIVVEGMGHVLSPSSRYWDVFADALIAHTAG